MSIGENDVVAAWWILEVFVGMELSAGMRKA